MRHVVLWEDPGEAAKEEADGEHHSRVQDTMRVTGEEEIHYELNQMCNPGHDRARRRDR